MEACWWSRRPLAAAARQQPSVPHLCSASCSNAYTGCFTHRRANQKMQLRDQGTCWGRGRAARRRDERSACGTSTGLLPVPTACRCAASASAATASQPLRRWGSASGGVGGPIVRPVPQLDLLNRASGQQLAQLASRPCGSGRSWWGQRSVHALLHCPWTAPLPAPHGAASRATHTHHCWRRSRPLLLHRWAPRPAADTPGNKQARRCRPHLLAGARPGSPAAVGGCQSRGRTISKSSTAPARPPRHPPAPRLQPRAPQNEGCELLRPRGVEPPCIDTIHLHLACSKGQTEHKELVRAWNADESNSPAATSTPRV